MKPIISVKEAGNILGDDATGITNTEILEVINTLNLLAKDSIQEVKR